MVGGWQGWVVGGWWKADHAEGRGEGRARGWTRGGTRSACASRWALVGGGRSHCLRGRHCCEGLRCGERRREEEREQEREEEMEEFVEEFVKSLQKNGGYRHKEPELLS